MNSINVSKKKKKASRNERTMGGSSATSPRRNIAAIIFKQAASGRSIFLPIPEGILIANSIARSGYFWDYAKVTLLEMRPPVPSHLALAPLSFEPDEPFYSTSPFSLTDFPFDARRNECGIIHGGLEEKEEFGGIEKKTMRKKKTRGSVTLSSHDTSHRRISRPRPSPPLAQFAPVRKLLFGKLHNSNEFLYHLSLRFEINGKKYAPLLLAEWRKIRM